MYLVWGEIRTFFFNTPYIPILGPRIDKAMGTGFEDLWADAYPSVEPLFLKALGGESSRIVDMPVPMARWGEPEETWWTFSYTPVTDDNGKIAGVLCITNETTATVMQAEAERRADAALRASERRLTRAQEAGKIGVFSIDIPSNTLVGTPEFYKLFGLQPADNMEASIIEQMVLPEDTAAISHADTRADQTAELHSEYRIRRLDDGDIRCIERRAEFEFDDQGKPVRLVGVVQDVTDRRNARDELSRLNRMLEATVVERTQALLLHENIIQSDVTAICAFDTQFRLIAFNQAHNDEFYRVNGFYTKIGDVFPDLFVPEQRAVMRAQMARALCGESFTVEEEFGNPEIDAPRWEIHYSPLRDGQGTIIGAFHHARDINARLRAQADLEATQEALRQSQKVEAIGQLTGGVAHDFNNLLTPILGSLDLLRRRAGLSDRETRLIHGAFQSAERAKTLVQRLLAFARRQPLQPSAVALGELIEGMTDLLASTCGPQIAVHLEIANDLPQALADPHQLEMAILNLCVNARDAMSDGGSIRIVADAAPRQEGEQGMPDLVRISVIDTGTGMDAATQAKAIEPFYSTKGIGKGTGLGLSMVHGLASQLGGSLNIVSEPGHGTCIELLLPVSLSSTVIQTNNKVPALPLGRGKVLLVDDEALVRMTAASMLEALGYDVTEVDSAREAEARLVAGETFDIVVTDHLMPGLSGAELARNIRKKWPRTSVLIVSGYAEAEGVPADLPRLAKPFREEELAEAIGLAMRY